MGKTNPCVLLALVALLTSECVVHSTIIDLSHPLTETTIYWPGVPSFERSIVANSTNENNVWIEVGAFTSGEHGGTHIDAPRHFYKTGYDLKDLPLEFLIAEGVMIDTKAEARTNNDYALTVEKIQEWEAENGRIPNRSAILVNNGWSARWPNPRSFFNTNDPTNPITFHFPIVSQQAAQWLVQNRDIRMLGLDVPAPDGPRDTVFPVHTMLLSRNIIILENMMIPDSLPSRGFRVHAAPIRIEGGTGVQTRIYAMMYDGNSAPRSYTCLSFISCVFVGLMTLFVSKFHSISD